MKRREKKRKEKAHKRVGGERMLSSASNVKKEKREKHKATVDDGYDQEGHHKPSAKAPNKCTRVDLTTANELFFSFSFLLRLGFVLVRFFFSFLFLQRTSNEVHTSSIFVSFFRTYNSSNNRQILLLAQTQNKKSSCQCSIKRD